MSKEILYQVFYRNGTFGTHCWLVPIGRKLEDGEYFGFLPDNPIQDGSEMLDAQHLEELRSRVQMPVPFPG